MALTTERLDVAGLVGARGRPPADSKKSLVNASHHTQRQVLILMFAPNHGHPVPIGVARHDCSAFRLTLRVLAWSLAVSFAVVRSQ